MPNLQRPGVYTTENLTVISPPLSVGPAIMGFAGEHWRGSTKPYICSSWNQFIQYYGGFNPNAAPVLSNPFLAFAVREFFNNGGTQAIIGRITSSSSPGITASTILGDLAATPQATLELTAGILGDSTNVGTWGNNLYVDIVNRGGAGSGRFDLKVYYGGYGPGFLVETWIDLSMNTTDPRYVNSLINSPVSGSFWIVATNLDSATAPPSNAPAPVAGRQFTGGIDSGDPSTSDRIVAITSGTSPFDSFEGFITFNLPGEVNTSVLNAALSYTQNRPYGFCVMDPPQGLAVSAVTSFFQGLSPIVDTGALYYPWVVARDWSSSSSQATQTLPPGGFILGQMSANDAGGGPWKSAAGTGTSLIDVYQTDGGKLIPTDLDLLSNANINPLKTLANGQVVIWGVRTMKTGFSTMYVPIRRTLSYVEATLVQLFQPFVFTSNMPATWLMVKSKGGQFLSSLFSQGAFSSSTASNAFYIICDNTNNTPQSVSQGILNVDVGVALANPAEYIVINLSLTQAGQSYVTTTLY